MVNCTSTYCCRFCQKKHNYLLHNDDKDSIDKKKNEKTGTSCIAVLKEAISSSSTSSTAETPTLNVGFIHTALISLQHNGKRITARAALDNCSTHSIISEGVASFLQPERKPISITMKGTVADSLTGATFLTGPSQYPLIAVILLQFRSYPIAVTADISKMYREVKLQEQDKDYHRFFLRNEDGKICEARMTRLTFGMRPSPFVATAVLRHHAELNKQEFPDASKAILYSFYVDDFIGGAATVEEALHLQQSLCKLLSMAGMNLRKWRSSHTEVLNQIPEEIQEKEDRKLMMKEESLKTLGTHWDAELDALFVTTPQPITSKNGEITKRVVAKVVAGLYDVLGIITPFSISRKIILQKLWELNIGWDQSIPAEMLPKWKTWTDGFQTVSSNTKICWGSEQQHHVAWICRLQH